MPNLRRWSTSATGNASVAGGATTINNAEGQLPSTTNNSRREEMAQVRQVYKPSEWGWVEHSSTASVASQTTVKVAANVTADYVAGRRIRLTGGSTTMYGDIVSASFTAETTVTLVKDSGSLSASMSIVAVAAVYDKNTPNYVTSNSTSAMITTRLASFDTVVEKTADETISNSSALQNDDHLFFAVAANTSYEFEFKFFYSSNSTADFQFTVTGPAAPTLVYFYYDQIVPDGTDLHNVYTAFSSLNALTYASGTVGFVKITGILQNGANAGTVQLQWAQRVATVTDTVVPKGGTLRYNVIA